MSLKASGLTGCSILIARLVDLSNDSLPGKEKVRNMGRGRVLTSYIITGYPELLAQSANIGALARGGNPERMEKGWDRNRTADGKQTNARRTKLFGDN